MTLLKICGLRQPQQAAAIAALGVDAVGVIAVSSSPRWVPPPQRAPLFAAAEAANPQCRGVLVVADPAEAELEMLQADGGHRVVQLHGAESPARCQTLRRRHEHELGARERVAEGEEGGGAVGAAGGGGVRAAGQAEWRRISCMAEAAEGQNCGHRHRTQNTCR